MSLGKKLSGYRRDAGYTQQQLGELLNVSAQAVSKWENDQAEPDLQMLRRLCLIYKIKMDDLFDEESAATERAPQAESAAPAGRAGSAEEKAPPSSAQAERKPLGHCVSCGKAVYKGNAARTILIFRGLHSATKMSPDPSATVIVCCEAEGTAQSSPSASRAVAHFSRISRTSIPAFSPNPRSSG